MSDKPNELVTVNPLFKDLGGNDEERKREYRSFLAQERPYDTVVHKAIFGRLRCQGDPLRTGTRVVLTSDVRFGSKPR